MYGLSNEPERNADGAQDGQVWQAMDHPAGVIRAAETAHGYKPHLIAVQATRNWARDLVYYRDHPIQAGGGRRAAGATSSTRPTSTSLRPILTGCCGDRPRCCQWLWANLGPSTA